MRVKVGFQVIIRAKVKACLYVQSLFLEKEPLFPPNNTLFVPRRNHMCPEAKACVFPK